MKALAYTKKEEGPRPVGVEEAVRIVEEEPEGLVWLDFDAPFTQKELELLEAPPFAFHELALEDASREDGQRPKVEEYEDYFFLVMHSVEATNKGGLLHLAWHEIDLFVGPNYVVSVRAGELPEISLVWKDALARRGIMQNGSGRLTYYLLDAVVDRYIDAVDHIEDVLDELEDAVIDPSADEGAVKDIFLFKRQLIAFRKKAGPLREAINEMTSRNFPHIAEDTSFYLRDVYDHLIRLSDMLDSYRDILTGALDVHLSAVSNRLNIIMKRLTIVATIFMPLAFLTGFWGMNFEQLPFRSFWWFWASIALMVGVAAVMIVIFRTRQYK